MFVDQEAEHGSKASCSSTPDILTEDKMEYPTWLAGKSQAVENSVLESTDDSLRCKEVFDSCAVNHSSMNRISYTDFVCNIDEEASGINNASPGIADLENIELDTPPDFPLAVSFTFYPYSSAFLTFLTHYWNS